MTRFYVSHYLQGFIHPRWCRSSSINSMANRYIQFCEGFKHFRRWRVLSIKRRDFENGHLLGDVLRQCWKFIKICNIQTMLVAKSGVPIVSSDMFACYCVSVKSSCIRVFFLPRHGIHLYSQLRHKYLHLKLSGCCIHTKQCFKATLDKKDQSFPVFLLHMLLLPGLYRFFSWHRVVRQQRPGLEALPTRLSASLPRLQRRVLCASGGLEWPPWKTWRRKLVNDRWKRNMIIIWYECMWFLYIRWSVTM